MDKATHNRIIALAYMHRYGWIFAMVGCLCAFPQQGIYALVGFPIGFSLWTVVGYHLKWKHIYCSWQNSSHMEMTPYSIFWNQIEKSYVYGIPLIFAGMALLLLYLHIKN